MMRIVSDELNRVMKDYHANNVENDKSSVKPIKLSFIEPDSRYRHSAKQKKLSAKDIQLKNERMERELRRVEKIRLEKARRAKVREQNIAKQKEKEKIELENRKKYGGLGIVVDGKFIVDHKTTGFNSIDFEKETKWMKMSHEKKQAIAMAKKENKKVRASRSKNDSLELSDELKRLRQYRRTYDLDNIDRGALK